MHFRSEFNGCETGSNIVTCDKIELLVAKELSGLSRAHGSDDLSLSESKFTWRVSGAEVKKSFVSDLFGVIATAI